MRIRGADPDPNFRQRRLSHLGFQFFNSLVHCFGVRARQARNPVNTCVSKQCRRLTAHSLMDGEFRVEDRIFQSKRINARRPR